jgi:hypothetical protein
MASDDRHEVAMAHPYKVFENNGERGIHIAGWTITTQKAPILSASEIDK